MIFLEGVTLAHLLSSVSLEKVFLFQFCFSRKGQFQFRFRFMKNCFRGSGVPLSVSGKRFGRLGMVKDETDHSTYQTKLIANGDAVKTVKGKRANGYVPAHDFEQSEQAPFSYVSGDQTCNTIVFMNSFAFVQMLFRFLAYVIHGLPQLVSELYRFIGFHMINQLHKGCPLDGRRAAA